VRRFTLITIIVLLTLLLIAAIFQIVAANKGGGRFPGPGISGSPTPSPTAT
jgi:hypothetical protein